MWGSSSTSGLPFQFQSTYLISSSSLLRPVLQFQSTYLISSSSLLRPVLQFQSTSSQDQPRVWGFFPVVPLHLEAKQVHLDWLIFVGSSLQGLIFIACGISLLCKDSSSFTAHLNGHDFFEMHWFFFCVCVFQLTVYFLLNVSLKCCSFILNCILNIVINYYQFLRNC